MNAPWKAHSGETRDIFAAFVCDETSLEALRPAVAEIGWPLEKCHLGGLKTAVQSLSIAASPRILLVDLSECGDPLHEIGTLAEVCEPGTLVIAIGQVNDVRLYRDLMASGLHDYLLKPLFPAQVRDALQHAQAVFNAPKTGDGEGVKPHIATAVVGTRGGVGASMLATSLAWMFAIEHKRPTALLDLDTHFGTGALTFDLEPGRGLIDAIEAPSRIDALFLERAMVRANDNLSILSAEVPINQPLITDGAAFMHLQEEFRRLFDLTVIDLPRTMLVNFPYVISEVNVIVVTTELTLAGARDTIRVLSWLNNNAIDARVLVVANKVNTANEEIGRADFESSIERKLDFLVPYDIKSACLAAKIGQSFAEVTKPSKVGAALRALAVAISPQEDDEAAKPAAKASILGKMGFKQLLSSKDAKPK